LPLHHDNNDRRCDKTLFSSPSLSCYNQQDNEGDDDNEVDGGEQEQQLNNMSSNGNGCGECVDPPSITYYQNKTDT
jgi:hypothetical protein